MRSARIVAGAVAAAVAAPAGLSGLLSVLATRPKLAAKVFGPGGGQVRQPADFGLASTDVEYAPGCRAWWIPAPNATADVVILHGYEPTHDPRSTDPGPRLELASMLQRHGFGSLVINLGYASGQHLHSGGALEAEDVIAAADWVRNRSSLPVALAGFSAGGHTCTVAAADSSPFAVVTDSSFVDFGEVVKAQGSAILKVPQSLFWLVPAMMSRLTGHRPVNLESDFLAQGIPMLHIHGDVDSAISPQNLRRISRVTGGEVVSIPGADHIEGLRMDSMTYESTVVDFLNRSVAAANVD